MADKKSAPLGKIESIDFHFIKSADYKVIHVDGAHGGISPHGYVQMTLYAERFPIPQITTHSITPEKQLGKETDRVGRDGLIRECAVTAMMDYRTTVALRDWLNQKIEILDKAKETQ